MATTQSRQFYTQHPAMRTMLGELKVAYDARQANSEAPRSLEVFYQHHDKKGNGEVRLEDFQAGWSLGGVRLGPQAISSLRGAYGNDERTIRYGEVLSDLDALGHTGATSMTMTSRMGAQTARYVGYQAAGSHAPPGYLGSLTYSQPTGRTSPALNTTSGPASLLRSTNIRPVALAGPSAAHNGTFNTTEIANAAVTQRHKSTTPRSAAAALHRLTSALAASGGAATMADALAAYDPSHTGCVTLDAFLTAAARAGVTVKPDELDALRAEGAVRRPYAAAPELVEYANLDGLF